MARKGTFTDTDFLYFQEDLLEVLKNDPVHKLDFADGKLLFRSRQYDCLLMATDVHWDSKSGDIVLVGAFRSGSPLIDESKGFPEFKKSIDIPLKECFDDLKLSSGNEMKLISKAKKAVIEKYIGGPVKRMSANGWMDNDFIDLRDFNLGNFFIERRNVIGLNRGEDGMYRFLCSDDYQKGFPVDPSRECTMIELQNLSKQLHRIEECMARAKEEYLENMSRQRSLSMSYSPQDDLRHRSAALVALYQNGYPTKIIDGVSRQFADIEGFSSRYSKREIAEMIENFNQTGVLRPVQKETGKVKGLGF